MTVRIWQQPELRNPRLIVGWPDMGYVGLKVVSYLKEKLGARDFGEIELYDFSLMPQSVIRDGVLLGLEFPRSEFAYSIDEKAEQDIIIFRSDVPALRQYQYVNLILDIAEQFRVHRIYTVGGFSTAVYHAAIPRVLTVVNREELKELLRGYNVDPAFDYHGPTSMNGLLLGVAKERGIEGVSLWGQVPHYLGELPNPMIAQAVLRALTSILALDIDFAGIEDESKYVADRIERMITYFRGQYPEFDSYLEKLEQGVASEMDEEESKRLFKEIEGFLGQDQSR